ncbi:MAG: hypothetical protein AB1768_05705 [Pseudomonadota bacterium]|jgi:hypothetical protein
MALDPREEKLQAYYASLVQLAQKAAGVLDYSWRHVGGTDQIAHLARSPEGMERLESLTSRFARLTDLLIQQVFRVADRLDQLEEGTPIDRLNRAERRGWIDSTQTWKRKSVPCETASPTNMPKTFG